MFEWTTHIDLEALSKTLIISLTIVLITLIIFHQMWLKNPFFKRKQEEGPLLAENFYIHMILLLWNLPNHRLWVDQVGFEGVLTSVLLPPLHPRAA
jgi:hypothetical protein